MSLFDLISGLLEPFFDLVPRIAHRPQSNEWMILDRWFRPIVESKIPRIFIPAITHVEYIPKNEIPIDCGLQRVTTADDEPVAVNATAIIKIVNPILCRDKAAEGYEEVTSLLIRGVVCDLIGGHNWSHLGELIEDGSYFDEVYHELEYYGIELVSLQVEDLQVVIPLSILR